MSPEKAFGEAIKKIRSAKGISQETLSYLSGLDRSFLSQIECGVKSPSLSTIFKLASALDTSMAEIMVVTEDRLARISG